MSGNLITSTVKYSMQPLAYQGIMAYTRYSQLTDMLRRKFGDESAMLFAEPVENRGNGVIDWYTSAQGAPRKLVDLPEEEKEAVAANIRKQAEAIEEYSNELASSQDQQKTTRGHVLRQALVIPNFQCIYLVGEQPVFVCWGFGPGTPGVAPKQISRLALPVKAAQASPLPQAVERQPEPSPLAPRIFSWAWLWWLLPLLAAILLFIILCTSFGNIKAISGLELFHAPALPFLAQDYDRGRETLELESEINDLIHKLNEYAAICQPQQKQEKTPELEPEGDLIIPPKAENASFLEGKWLCDTGLISKMTGEPVSLAFSFDSSGNGTAITYEANDQCVGPVKAEMLNGDLKIHVGEAVCSRDSHTYAPIEIICSNANNESTQCHGTHSDGHTWSAPFRRVR